MMSAAEMRSAPPPPVMTLHVTLLTAHYTSAIESHNSTAMGTGGTVSGTGHRKDTSTVKASSSSNGTSAANKATDREKDALKNNNSGTDGEVSADQLDSVARVLCSAVRQHASAESAVTSNSGCTRHSDSIAFYAHRMQIAKAVRDGAVPWTCDAESSRPSIKEACSSTITRPHLSSSSSLLFGAGLHASVDATTRSSARASIHSRSAAQRQRTSSTSSRSGGAAPSSAVAHLTSSEAECSCLRSYLDAHLPACELVDGTMEDMPTPGRNQAPMIFLYRLDREDEVVAALSQLDQKERLAREATIGVPAVEYESRLKHANRAAALVTQAVWSTIRPVLRTHLHATDATSVPSDLSVVWAVTDPRLLRCFNCYVQSDESGTSTFYPCSVQTRVVDGAAVASAGSRAECQVRLMPRVVLYFYDPVVLSASPPMIDPGSATVAAMVQAALHAIQDDDQDTTATVANDLRTVGGAPTGAESAKSGARGSSGNNSNNSGGGNGKGSSSPPCGGAAHQQAVATAKQPRNISGTAAAAAGLVKSVNSNGRGGDGGGVVASNSAASASDMPFANEKDAAASKNGNKMRLVDLDVNPADFPYCTADAASLACYLYAGGGVNSEGAPPTAAALASKDIQKEGLISFLTKAKAYSHALQTASSPTGKVVPQEKPVDRGDLAPVAVTAAVLNWLRRFLCTTPVAAAGEHTKAAGDRFTATAATSLDAVATESLASGAFNATSRPLPPWCTTAVPLAPLPPLSLLGSAAATNAAADALATNPSVPPHLKTWCAALLSGIDTPWSSSTSPITSALRNRPAESTIGLMLQMGGLVAAYAAWSQRDGLGDASTPRTSGGYLRNRWGTTAVNQNKPRRYAPVFSPDCYTGGVFTVVNAASALMAQASNCLTCGAAPPEVTAVCRPHTSRAPHVPADVADSVMVIARSPSLSLLRRYPHPFHKLASKSSNASSRVASISAAAVVAVPRTTMEEPATEAGDQRAGEEISRCVVRVGLEKDNADVLFPPHPQEMQWMVRQMTSKNAGHFEVNTAHGTDTVTTALAGGAAAAVLDLTMTGSFSFASRRAMLNTTVQGTGLLHHQQQQHQQQQRRRQRSGPAPAVVANLRPYVHAVRTVKEVSKALVGGRPITEATVLLQAALESTLATPPARNGEEKADNTIELNSSKSGVSQHHRGEANAAPVPVKVNALEVLKRYVTRSPVPRLHPQPGAQANFQSHARQPAPSNRHVALAATASRGAPDEASSFSLGAAAAASAAAQRLTPRVYEHCLQQALLQQFLHDSGLIAAEKDAGVAEDKRAPENWDVTEQTPAESVVPALVDFRERFGAHNVVWRAYALEYTPPPLVMVSTPNTTTTTKEVHQTSAYAHNALNVHPTRRAAQMWIAGVPLPRTTNAGDQEAEHLPKSRHKVGADTPPHSSCSLRRCRACKWVDMVARASASTPLEMHAMWGSFLRTHTPYVEHSKTSVSANVGPSSLLPLHVTPQLAQRLLAQFVQKHAEASTALVAPRRSQERLREGATQHEKPEPFRFDIHETLHPYGDALLEVWVTETQRTCRYIKATELMAALHASAPAKSIDATSPTPLHLSVRWDDGLLFSCTSGSNRTGEKDSKPFPLLPPTDVYVTTSNFVLQRRHGDARLRLRRYTNTSSSATAAAVAAMLEAGGSQQQQHGAPQGLLHETAALLLEQRVTLYCVQDSAFELPTAWTPGVPPSVTLEASVQEAAVSIEVNEGSGVVHHTYASGVQQMLFPSGAMLTRYPVSLLPTAGANEVEEKCWCDTLITWDGRCFVRHVSETSGTATSAASASASHFDATTTTTPSTIATGTFCRVAPHLRNGAGQPDFTEADATYDAVQHCHVRSRRDGLIIVEYGSLVTAAPLDAGETMNAAANASSVVIARVVVFPDGTSIATVAPREARERVLLTSAAFFDGAADCTARVGRYGEHVRAAVTTAAFASAPLCAMLEELKAVEDSLFGPHSVDSLEEGDPAVPSPAVLSQYAAPSVRWSIEAPTLPRMYLAPAKTDEKSAFAVVFGDGTALHRRWTRSASQITMSDGSRYGNAAVSSSYGGMRRADESDYGKSPRSTSSSPSYEGGTAETLLVRPSTSAVRVLHQHALAMLEPADVMVAITSVSPAAYAVGQGLPFFDLAYGGGLRLVDTARCVWEVCELSASVAAGGPQIVYPDRSCTYEELLCRLMSAHHSPHHLPRAAELASVREQRREAATYARQRASGWCPPLLRRLRELSEPYICGLNLLRADAPAPEAAILSASTRATTAPHTSTSDHASCAALPSIPPLCFGQLANGETLRYWRAKEVLPSASAQAAAAAIGTLASEPDVVQRAVSHRGVGSLLGYVCSGPHSCSAADVMAAVSAGVNGGDGGGGGRHDAVARRLAEANRLALLCLGHLAPPISPALQSPTLSPAASKHNAAVYASLLPPVEVLLQNGSRWLPQSLQPPQQFSGADNSGEERCGGASSGDVVWLPNTASTAPGGGATRNSLYVQYVAGKSRGGSATDSAALRTAVARHELHRHHELAQLSRYHRVLTRQWPMELPVAAREEQVRLEGRYDELQRARRAPAVPAPGPGSAEEA